MNKTIRELRLDHFDAARAIHRVVRAMHDGECPACHYITSSDGFQLENGDEKCFMCGFTITEKERELAIATFAPVMAKNLQVFIEWKENGYKITI